MNAVKWLQDQWAAQNRQAQMILDAVQLGQNLLNILLNALGKGTIGIIIATLGIIAMLPSLLGLFVDWYSLSHPKDALPAWVVAIKPALDGLATVANFLNGFVGLASWVLDWSAGLIKKATEHVVAIASNVITSLTGVGIGKYQLTLDRNAWQEYQLTHNMWDSQTILETCRIEGGC